MDLKHNPSNLKMHENLFQAFNFQNYLNLCKYAKAARPNNEAYKLTIFSK
jgi:hypothetical protein